MASKKTMAIALFLVVNICFNLVAACGTNCPSPTPNPKPKPKPVVAKTCPKDTLKLGVCAGVLGSLLHLTIGKPPKEPCCSLIGGLVDLEAAVCLCTALKLNVMGINLDIPLSRACSLMTVARRFPPASNVPKCSLITEEIPPVSPSNSVRPILVQLRSRDQLEKLINLVNFSRKERSAPLQIPVPKRSIPGTTVANLARLLSRH